MVKKLFKHEMDAYWRVMIPVWVILLSVATVGRIIQIFEQKNVFYNIVSGSAIVMYVVALLAAIAFPAVYGVIRYYTNFFTGEGYLTFTLPTTPGRLLSVKIITAALMQVITLGVAALSAVIITLGDVLVEVWKAGVYLWNEVNVEMEGHLTMLSVEMVLLFLLAILYAIVFFETCINIGQLFPKLRILAAVGVYFAVYTVEQILVTIGLIVMAFAEVNLDTLVEFIDLHPYLFLHGTMWMGIVLTAVFTLLCYLLSRHIITKRLNLE